MITETQAREALLAGDTIADIGQLDAPTKRMLAKNVRVGRVVKFRAPWCGLREKTFYRMTEMVVVKVPGCAPARKTATGAWEVLKDDRWERLPANAPACSVLEGALMEMAS